MHNVYSFTIHIFKGRLLKISFSSDSEPEIFTSVAPTYTKLSSFIPIYIQIFFTEGFFFFRAVDSIFSDLWSDTKRYPKFPLQKLLTLLCQQN